MSVIIKLLSKFDDSGIKKAQSQFGGLKKTLATIGVGVGIKQLADTLMDAGKAAAADQKSMRLLNDQLVKNGKATKAQVAQNNKFIDSLSTQVGIVDDNLRPAMGKLVRATGSVSKAQDLLKLSLDASAVAGKPLDTVAQAISKAFNGNTSALTRMFPELKKSKDLFGDLRKEVSGAAVTQADPFSRLNVAMDNLKEKLGYIILPYVTQFVDSFTKPGGMGDVISKFLDDVSNPKTEAGKTFVQIKDAVKATIQGVKDFFALFGNGDAMKGFGNFVSTLVKALPALLALKGILGLAQGANAIRNLTLAIIAARGGTGAGGGTPTVVGGGKGAPVTPVGAGKGAVGGKFGLMSFATLATVGMQDYKMNLLDNPAFLAKHPELKSLVGRGSIVGNLGANPLVTPMPTTQTNNVTINVNGGDPKHVTNALQQYLKTNNGKVNTSGKFGR